MSSLMGNNDGANTVALAMEAISTALRTHTTSFAFCGDIAYSIYNKAVNPPQVVELLLLPPLSDISGLMEIFVTSDPTHFFFKHSRDGSPTEKVEYRATTGAQDGAQDIAIEIHLTLSFGSFSPNCLFPVNGLPLVPFSYLILQRLLLWGSSTNSSKRPHPGKLLQMLLIYRDRGFVHERQFYPELHAACQAHVVTFFNAYPWYKREWEMMGFLTSLPSASSKPVNLPKSLLPFHVVDTETKVAPEGGTPNIRANQQSLTGTKSSVSGDPGALSKRRNRRKAAKENRDRFTPSQIRSLAAHTTAEVLRKTGFSCAIFGSLACQLYGSKREPNDVDILVLPPPSRSSITQEEVKILISQNAPEHCHFRLVRAKDRTATYRVFYFLPEPKPPSAKRSDRPPPHKSSKVDILLPGIMHLPALSQDLITWTPGPLGSQKVNFPLVPFPVLLLQKLQGWDDHRLATEERYRKKVPTDERDLWWLLGSGVALWLGESLEKLSGSGKSKNWGVWSDRRLFSEEFEKLSRNRVKIFCDLCPSLGQAWKDLGFEIL